MRSHAFIHGLTAAVVMVAVTGCSGAGGLTTGSVFSGAKKEAAAPSDPNTPTNRALQVGATSARAMKCGYNFDPAALRANYIAAEASAGLTVDQVAKLETIYDTSFNGVTKAVSNPDTYCTVAKTTVIKADLTRHLGGDYSVPPRKVAKADDSLFGWLGDNVADKGPAFGSDDWWEKQRQDSGK